MVNKERWKYQELSEYNYRVSQGIVHTKEFKKRMEKIQKEFNDKSVEVENGK